MNGSRGSDGDDPRRVVWALDVDGTLIGSIRSDVLRPGAAELLEAARRRGITCVLWSAGGADYAERIAERFRIAHHFEAFYAKGPRGPDGRYTIDHFHEAHTVTTFVDDSPLDLPVDGHVIAVSQFFGGHAADGVLVRLANDLSIAGESGSESDRDEESGSNSKSNDESEHRP